MKPFNLALLSDMVEENWPSMDLVSDMLYSRIAQGHSADCHVSRLRPAMRRRVSGLPIVGKKSLARNADRLINRFVDYPLSLTSHIKKFDVFHVLDHSYSQLIHQLPADRTVVSCHDLDAFKCLLYPTQEKRSKPFRLMVKRIMNGFSKAGHIICDSQSVREELLRSNVVAPERTSVVLHGTHPSCSPIQDPQSNAEADTLLGNAAASPYLLHVGSTIPRKAIDVLLLVFAKVRQAVPEIRLVRVGGAFTRDQEGLAFQLGVRSSVSIMPQLDRSVLAAFYRRAALLLLPSRSEGFGLPLVEAIACGCPVVASDIPVLREIGGQAAQFCTVGDITEWSGTIVNLLKERMDDPVNWERRRSTGVAWAAQYSWERSAAKCVDIYKKVLEMR